MDEDPRIVTFMNEGRLSKTEIGRLFRDAGEVINVFQIGNRMFVKYSEQKSADLAIQKFGYLGVSIAKKKSKDQSSSNKYIQHNSSNQQKTFKNCNTTTKVDSKDSFNKQVRKVDNTCTIWDTVSTKSDNSGDQDNFKSINGQMQKLKSIPPLMEVELRNGHISQRTPESDHGNSGSDDKSRFDLQDVSCPPPLIDAKEIPKVYCLVLGNLPEQFTLDDVYNLVEEAKPAAFTQMDVTDKGKIKFCQIYVKSREGVDYLSNKLNGFVICGKKLIAMESSKILAGARWDI